MVETVESIDDFWEGVPSREEAECTRRLLAGLYGRQDLGDMAEGIYCGPEFYDHEGRYIGEPKSSEAPASEDGLF